MKNKIDKTDMVITNRKNTGATNANSIALCPVSWRRNFMVVAIILKMPPMRKVTGCCLVTFIGLEMDILRILPYHMSYPHARFCTFSLPPNQT